MTPDAIVSFIEAQTAWQILPLDVAHLHALSDIDVFADHTDPFDRLLIAQASREKLTLVSADAAFSRYSTPVIW